jgi:hypothetical protein
MALPIWLTPAGSLGTIPEGIFYQQTLFATTAPVAEIVCTATSSTDNRVTCTSTADIWPGMNVIFSGQTFGGISDTTRYFVLAVVNSTQFTLTTTEFSSTPVTLSTGSGSMTAVFTQHVYYRLQSGSLPDGIQVSDNGVIEGVPMAVASLQGVPFEVGRDVTSKFVIRAYTLTRAGARDRIADRTFDLTINGDDIPDFATPAGSIGTFYDSDLINYQILLTDSDPDDVITVRLVAGELPNGVTVTPSGLITGYIEPAANIDETPGYDVTPSNSFPYDFIVSSVSRNYQFTLEVTDGRQGNLRTFEFFVWDRASLTADNTIITADDTTITADITTARAPFITNAVPNDLGTVRGDNYYAYQFLGNDFDTTDIRYAISVNQGFGLPPGLGLDPESGWLYGYIPDQGITEVEYSFNISVYQRDPVGSPVAVTATTFGTNRVTCASTANIGAGTAIKFYGTGFGNISSADTTIYYVLSVVSSTQFTITANQDSTVPVSLTTSSGSMTFQSIVTSPQYPFTLTVTGAIDAEVTWLTPANLGTIENGETSVLVIQAENRGGRELKYRLESGGFNELPQGTQLLPTGEIIGRVSFNTFAFDLGDTVIDDNTTTWDSTLTFTVNAYAEDTEQVLFKVESVDIVNGGTSYSSITPPALVFSTPIGASASQAQVGNVVVTGGAVTSVTVSDGGGGYTDPATLVVAEGFGGVGAVFEPVMQATGVRDVVSAFKTFTMRLIRTYNKPYQNLLVEAMPPESDRVFIDSLLNNQEIFVPDYIYRPEDPNFGKATRVVYQHAFGLEPDILDQYVASLYLNHYWKNLVLGSIETAQALNADGTVLYEVVYSRIVDNLTNNDGQSVSKIVTLPYAIIDPADESTEIRSVYPNSLVNMRDQVIDVVGQLSNKLPQWMVSKQPNGRVLGFTPAWVLCYTQPGRAKQIAYYIQNNFAQQLNRVDFKVDRYVLDRTLSANWDTATQNWTPEPNLTTFDRFDTVNFDFIGTVDIGTNLAFVDINQRPLSYINSLGGFDGIINQVNGSTLIFVNQESYPTYPSIDAAWQNYLYPYDTTGFDATGVEFDESVTVPGGDGSTVNERMAVWRITVDPVTEIVSLAIESQTVANDYVQVTRGTEYIGAELYYPTVPGSGFTEVSWLPLVIVPTDETTFDQGSMAFEEPVDMYDPTDRLDKYLVFPKSNILV